MMKSIKAPSRFTPRTTAVAVLSLVLGCGGLPTQAASSVHSVGHRASGLKHLLAIEDATEAIAEGETTSSMAVMNARKAVSLWPTVRVTFRQNGATATQIVAVDGAIAALHHDLDSGRALTRDANEVTGALAPLFKIAGDNVPAEIHYLDYLGRSIALDARGGDWARAQRDAHLLQSRWTVVRHNVAARHGGGAAADEFDRATRAVISAVEAHSETKTLSATIKIGAAVDTVETTYG